MANSSVLFGIVLHCTDTTVCLSNSPIEKFLPIWGDYDKDVINVHMQGFV